MSTSTQACRGDAHYRLRLYLTGDAPNSRIARENLRRFCELLPPDAVSIEIIDVNTRPDAALAEGVYVTPALKVISPNLGGAIYGTLGDVDMLRTLFGV